MSENDLNGLDICERCHTVYEKRPLKKGEKAVCRVCGSVLYRQHKNLLSKIIALSSANIIFFTIFLLFPIVSVDINGSVNAMSVLDIIIELFRNGFWLVAALVTLSVILFPLTVHTLYLLTALSLKTETAKKVSKYLLKTLSHLLPWSMSDIFLISFFVAMVKLIGYARIHFTAALLSFAAFVAIDTYLTKYLKIKYLWEIYEKIAER